MMMGCPVWVWITVGILLIVALVVVIANFSKDDTKLLQKAGNLGLDSNV
jgi:dolichyl-phosphate-mannose--protein O-mannosyl transferase